MSKSYNNTIPLFEEPKKLQKLINKIKTDSLPPEAPKDPDASVIFTLYKEFATEREVEIMQSEFQVGIAWGDAKRELFRVMNRFIEEPREKYKELLSAPAKMDAILKEGAEKARAISVPFLKEVKEKIGFNV